ncbi:dTMP kinase [Natronocella acetinitrilica]|uniref:Thymidylate kinase n=2 Tax=Natronocella acetinitrilica TaxID=414046 RepID=A0AAE3G3R5_9GAMM|nr:dTMP kinase [Natronocella acetinitrilica]
MVREGMLIVADGGEGAGKTTAMNALEAALRAEGHTVVRTREPGGTALAEEIRGLALSIRDEVLDPQAELLLMFASRAQHVANVIRPALARGAVVLCDRFTSSTFAYQGAGRGLSRERIALLAEHFQGGVTPALTVVFDIDPAIGMARARGRGALDRLESERMDFFERVRADYLRQASEDPARHLVVDASRSPERVAAAVIEPVLERCAPLLARRVERAVATSEGPA